MAQQQNSSNEWLMLGLLAGGAYLAWKYGLFTAIGSPATTSNTTTTTTTPVTPATPSLSAGGVPSDPNADAHTTAGQPNLELFNATGYNNYWTTFTGNIPQAQSESIGSIKSNGGNWILYSQPNYSGASVAVSGLDYPDATALLSSLGGSIGSVKYLGS